MTHHAQGTFNVTLVPQPSGEGEAGTFDRYTIDKQFQGDLAATSKGQMLSVLTEVDGSAGYVALERVEGTLGGRSGSFVLQHNGTMDRSDGKLTITVVPDSGTGGLAGLTGSMNIIVIGANHTYQFGYSLADA